MMTPLDDDALAALLKDDKHVDDAGFADRVVARLPRRRATLGRRDWIVAASALMAASVGALAWSSGGAAAFELARDSWIHGSALAVGVGVGLWGAVSAATSET